MSIFNDPVEEAQHSGQLAARFSQWNAYRAQVRANPQGAEKLAGIVRDYPTVDPDIAAAIAYSGLSADDPAIHEIIERSTREQADGIWAGFQALGRCVTGTFQDVWDNSLPRALRMGVSMAQGYSPSEAYTTSGQTLASMAVEETKATGAMPSFNRIFGSSGFIAGDGTDPALHPGSSEVFMGYANQGYDPEQALAYTREWQLQHNSGSLVDRQRAIGESTLLHNTLGDGRTVSYTASPGRILWYPALKNSDPDSFFFNQVTGWTDAALQIGADPFNPGFDALTAGVRAHRTAVRAADLTASENAHNAAVASGGRSVDTVDYDIAFHGTTANELEGGVITRGGVTSRLEEARRLATPPDRATWTEEFRQVQDRTLAAEKDEILSPYSSEATEVAAAQARGEATWEDFSRARGYTEEEIADYRRFLEMVGDADQGDIAADFSTWPVQEGTGSTLFRADPDALYDARFGQGTVHVIDPATMPESLQAVYNAGDGSYKTIEQIIDRQTAVGAFPDMAPERIFEEARKLEDARRYLDSDAIYRAFKDYDPYTVEMAEEIYKLFDPDYIDEVAEAGEDALYVEGDLFSSIDEIRAVVDDWDGAEELVAHIDRYEEAQRIVAESPLAGDLNDAQRALVERMSILERGKEFVWGEIDEAVTPKASFSLDEIAEMESLGYVFDTREGFESYKAWLDEIAEMGAQKARGKWFVNPRTWERWSDSSAGARMFQYIADNGYSAIRNKLPGMSEDLLWRLHDSTNVEEIRQIVKQWYGGPNSRYTVPVRSRTANSMSALQHRLGGPGKVSASRWMPDSNLSAFGRRMVAEMGHSRIDPYDPSVTFDYVNSSGRLLGRTQAEIDHALRWLDEADIRLDEAGKPIKTLRERGRRLQEEIYGWIHADLAKMHGDEYATHVIDEWRKHELRNRQFAENANARPLDMRSADGRVLRNQETGGTLELMGGDPLLDSQLGQRSYFMPSVREIRRATAAVRKGTEILRVRKMSGSIKAAKEDIAKGANLNTVAGLSTSGSQAKVDALLAGWRNLALLRLGWMMRVIPDEIARMYVSGYNDIMTNPLAYILYSAGKRGDYLAEGKTLHQMTETLGLGADNGLFRGADNAAYEATSVRGANWVDVRASTHDYKLTPNGANGVARRILQLHQSRLADVIYDHATIEDALRYLVDDIDGNGILRSIYGSAEEGTQLHKAATRSGEGQTQLRKVLEAIDAQRHQYTGGAWVGKDANGNWVHMDGRPVNLYDVDRNTLQSIADERGLPRSGNKEAIRRRILEDDGLPGDLPKRKEAYIVTRQGQPELLDVIRTGRMQGTPNPNRAKVNAANDWFYANFPKRSQGEFVFVIDEVVDGEPVQAYTSYATASRKLGEGQVLKYVEKESLSPSTVMQKADANGRITLSPKEVKRAKFEGSLSGQDLKGLTDEALEEGTIPLVKDAMDKDDFVQLEEFLTNAYNADYPPVSRVSAPDRAYIGFDGDTETVVDWLFRQIGQNPTLFGVRRPFSTLRTWEVMAGHYVGASPAVRKQIMANAQKAGMADRFARFVDDALEARGLKRPVQTHTSSVDDIVALSWSEAIDDTKDLFYDLTKGAGWADASRIVFPFADAWWEVLSRWGKLMNPAVTGGQPLRAARRLQAGVMGADSSGFFTENEDGHRVFEIPGTTTLWNAMNPDSPVQMGAQVSFEQLTFVDFGAPSQVYKPGFGPQVQLLASGIRNVAFDKGWLPEPVRDNYDKFFFGDFSPPSSDIKDQALLFMPTWVRRAISRFYTSEFDDDYATLMTHIASGYAASVGEIASTDEGVAKEIVTAARDQASLIGLIDIFSSNLSPAQPRKVAELLLVDQDGTEYLKSISALATDFRMMKDIYGPQQAVDIFRRSYGFDPLKLAPSYWSDERAPVTNDAWEYFINNPAIGEHTRFTTMAFLPEDSSEFNIDAWRAAEYEKLTGEDVKEYWSYAAGAHRLAAVREARDEVLADMLERYGSTDNAGYQHMYQNVIKPWYDIEKANIDSQYYGYDPGEGLAGVSNRPSYRRIWKELTNIGTAGSQANIALKEVNPELVGFIEFSVELWEGMEQMGMEMGYGHEWWQTSESAKNFAPLMRETYSKALSDHVAGLSSPLARSRAEYIGQYFLAPLLTGFDWDNPVVIAPSMPSTSELGYADKLGARE